MLTDFLRLISGFILFIGPSEAGKTSILRRLVTGIFDDQEPTLGFREEHIAKVRVIEIGGQETFRKYWKQAMEQKPVKIFFVIDILKKEDLFEFQDFIKEYPTELKNIILIANKSDLVQKVPSKIKNIDYSIICSAKKNEGLLDILESIAGLKDSAEAKNIPYREVKKNTEKESEEKAETILKEFRGKF